MDKKWIKDKVYEGYTEKTCGVDDKDIVRDKEEKV